MQAIVEIIKINLVLLNMSLNSLVKNDYNYFK